MEKAMGTRWRLRESHRVLSGVFAPDEWTPHLVVLDSTAFVVPRNMASGAYDVRVKMIREPHYPNTTLKDYLHDDDAFSGPVVGHVTVQKP